MEESKPKTKNKVTWLFIFLCCALLLLGLVVWQGLVLCVDCSISVLHRYINDIMSELDHFRTKWLHELNVNEPAESGDKLSLSPQHKLGSSHVDDAVNVWSSSALFRGSHNKKAQRGKQVFKFESNTSCQSNPRAFEIADRLLQGEFLTGEYLFAERGKKRNRGPDDRIEAKKVPLSKKCFKVQPDSSLLDAFLRDLVRTLGF